MQSSSSNENGNMFRSESIPTQASPLPFTPVEPESSSIFSNSNKNMIILILTVLLVLSFLGINLLNVLGNILQYIVQITKPLIIYILSFFGYTAGTILTTTADVVGDTVITGVDIAQESVKSAGELLKDTSRTSSPNLDQSINKGSKPVKYDVNEPEPAKTSNPVVSAAGGAKKSWCLVGEHMEKRACIEIDEYDKCMSGQIYPSQKMCLNPTMSP